MDALTDPEGQGTAGRSSGGSTAAPVGESVNIAAKLEHRARRHPDRVAIVEGRARRRRQVTFGELADRVARLGGELTRRGLAPGDRVLLFVPMSLDLYHALLAVLHAGATAVFVDAWAGRRRLEQAVAAAEPAAFVGSPRAHLLRLLSPSLRRIPLRIWAGPGPLRLDRKARRPRRAGTGRATGPATPHAVSPDDPALITFTTGTTGRPKAAARSHDFLWAQHRVLARHLGLREDDIDMPTLPVFVLNNLGLGVTSVLPDFDPRRPADIDPAPILAQMRAEGVTTTSGSPAFYDRLADHVLAHGDAIPVRALFTGGAPVFPPLAERLIAATAGEVHVLYGSTEAEPIAALPARELVEAGRDADAMGVCAGEPVAEIDWRLVRPTDGALRPGPGGPRDLAVGPGETGELLVAGDHVLTGYLNDPESEAATKVRDDGRVWHRTGDGARFDGRRLWLMGRVSQRVERQGETWWGMAAEARAMAVPGVAHAAYLEWPDGSGRALLCVEPADGTAGQPGRGVALEDGLRAALSPIPVDEIRELDIPRDPRHASKTDLGALRDHLRGG